MKLTNDFHGTEITVRPRDGRLSARQCHRAWVELCGLKDCVCGGIAGERGHQWNDEGNRVYLEYGDAEGRGALLTYY